MKQIISILFTLFLLTSFACTPIAYKTIRISGNVVEKKFDFKGFSTIELENDIKAYIRFTDNVDEDQVRIEANANLMEYIKVDMDNDILKIEFNNEQNIRGNLNIKAYISSSKLKNFYADEDSEIYLRDELRRKNVQIELGGDSKLEGDVHTKNLKVKLRGDSVLKISGEAENMEANIKGDSQINSFNMIIEEVDASLAGDSEAYLHITKNLKARVIGDSELHYRGGAKIVSQQVLGDSEIVIED